MPQKTNHPVANPLMVLREEFDDWAILFNPDTGEAFGMNPVSVLIWKKLDGKHGETELVKLVKEHCSEVPAEVDAHVVAFLKELEEKGFVGYEK
jgi:SynChlorMet cassette protein ScmD